MPDVKRTRGQAKKSNPDPNPWLTRDQVIDMFGISVNTLINWEKRGYVNPVKVAIPDRSGGMRQQWTYNPHELAKVPRGMHFSHSSFHRPPGETAAQAFEHFNNGLDDQDIVIKLRETPEKIAELRERWLDGGGAHRVISTEAWSALEAVVGPFTTVADLIDIVTKKLPTQR